MKKDFIYNISFRVIEACGCSRIESREKWKLRLCSLYKYFINVIYIIIMVNYIIILYTVWDDFENMNLKDTMNWARPAALGRTLATTMEGAKLVDGETKGV